MTTKICIIVSEIKWIWRRISHCECVRFLIYWPHPLPHPQVQEREQDLTQDIETLRTENSHHSGAISKLQVERDSLKTSSVLFRSELGVLTNKLTKTEKCYAEVEQENLVLQVHYQIISDFFWA